MIIVWLWVVLLARGGHAYYWMRADPHETAVCPPRSLVRGSFGTEFLNFAGDPDEELTPPAMHITTECFKFEHDGDLLLALVQSQKTSEYFDSKKLTKHEGYYVGAFNLSHKSTLVDTNHHIAHTGVVYFKMARALVCEKAPVLMYGVSPGDQALPLTDAQFEPLYEALYNIENTDGVVYPCLTFYEYSVHGPLESPQPLGWGGLISIALFIGAIPAIAAGIFVAVDLRGSSPHMYSKPRPKPIFKPNPKQEEYFPMVTKPNSLDADDTVMENHYYYPSMPVAKRGFKVW